MALIAYTIYFLFAQDNDIFFMLNKRELYGLNIAVKRDVDSLSLMVEFVAIYLLKIVYSFLNGNH